MNALFTPLDMTNYESTFVGWNEIGGLLPINSLGYLKPLQDEPWAQKDALMAIEDPEKRPIKGRTKAHIES